MQVMCEVMVQGEGKNVAFAMDFAHDTPLIVAREMMEELGLEDSEGTLADIIRQIEQARPAEMIGAAPTPRTDAHGSPATGDLQFTSAPASAQSAPHVEATLPPTALTPPQAATAPVTAAPPSTMLTPPLS